MLARTHKHTHTVGPRVAIKNNGLWLGVAMAIERRKAAGKVELMFGDGDQCFFSGCSSSHTLSVPLCTAASLSHDGNTECGCTSTVYAV